MPHPSHPPAPPRSPQPRVASRRRSLAGLATFVLLAPVVAACSRDAGGSSVTTAHASGESARTTARPAPDLALPNIERATTPYVAQTVADDGSVTGLVELDGPAPTDSAVTPPEEIRRQCGASLVQRTVAVQGGRLAGAVVWLEGARRGKPLPSLRRHEVTIAKCQLTPRAQAVAAGGTLHVHSVDRIRTLVRLIRWPGGETAGTVATNDDGEVVPDDRVLSRVAALEVKGLQPAWLRAWVLVFDHPYATTTPAAGTFALDSVPPGEYRLVAWHERLGRVEQPVTVAAGQATNVTLRMRAGATPNGDPVGDSAGADTARRAGAR